MSLTRRSFAMVRLVLTLLALFHEVLAAQEVILPSDIRHHEYLDSFPNNAEYDMAILDPTSVNGSPYGGFARNTPSRLASLPLYLPDEIFKGGDVVGMESMSYTVRDAQGRLFACKTFSEDELIPESLNESMFTAPKFRSDTDDQDVALVFDEGVPNTASSPELPNNMEDKNMAESVRGSRGDSKLQHTDLEDSKDEKASNDASRPPRGQASLSRSSGSSIRDPNPLLRMQYGAFPDERDGPDRPPIDESQLVKVMEAEKVISQLKGVCAQIHLGWWSYEWCHVAHVTQFHISVEVGTNNQPIIELQDVTNLGSDHTLKIIPYPTDIAPLKGHRSKDWDWSDMRSGLEEVAMVTYEFTKGDPCPDTGKPRETKVHYRCCSSKQMRAFKSGTLLLQGEPIQADFATLVAFNEDPYNVCHYEAVVCTHLLCRGDVQSEVQALPSTVTDHQQSSMLTPKKPRKENESIRETLARILTNVCLRHSDGGWWIYEVCHGKQVRQFHEANLIDRMTGMSVRTVETQHVLGSYSIDDLEGFPNADEIRFVVNATDDHGVEEKRTSDQRGNGAYFMQEYRSGDLCDHSDVTDAAIKAGDLGKGGIKRSTTIRWFCGKRLELVQASEDSTCHYVIDIDLPELCQNPLFKAPVSKKKVVKCLPVK